MERTPASRRAVLIAAAVVLAVALLGSGCVRVPLPPTSDSGSRPGTADMTTIESGRASKLKGRIRMGVGELNVRGGTPTGTAFAGRFDYAPASWKPSVESTTTTDTIEVRVSQPSDIEFKLGEQRNRWDLYLSPKLVADLEFLLGVGESNLDLRDVDVSSLHVVTGVGDTKIDLSGKRLGNVDVNLDTGVGSTTVLLPADCRIDIIGSEGIGSIGAEGFTESVGGYTYFGHGGPQITVMLTRGVGDVTFKLVNP